MAKFPTDIDESITVAVSLARAYAYLWDVVCSARVSMAIRYTARYSGNGQGEAAKSAQEFLANVKHSLESEARG